MTRLTHRHFLVAMFTLATLATLTTSALAQQQSTSSATRVSRSPASRNPASPFASATLQSPKVAYVAATQADVWSGPGDEPPQPPNNQNASAQQSSKQARGNQAHGIQGRVSSSYRTSSVSRGSALEVFHRTDRGWLGIRPPEGSFSWVMAKDAFLLPGGRTIEITGDKAVSWIGTELENKARFRWQVQLSPGEKLTVLGESESVNSAGERVLWYKVAPPSGEFRWINETLVSTEPPVEPGIARTIPSRNGINARQPVEMAAAEMAAGSGRANASNVTTAGYRQETEIFGGSILEGQAVDGPIVDSMGNSFTMDDGRVVHDGDVIYLDGHGEGSNYDPAYMEYGPVEYTGDEGYAVESLGSGSMWDGWHAVELTDDGFRIPFLERRYQQAQARHGYDPRNHDPFSLAMIKQTPVAPPSIQEQVRQDVGIAPNRRYTPWRDPRELREQRMQGYPSARTSNRDVEANRDKRLSYRDDTADIEARLEEAAPSATGLLSRFASALSKVPATDSQFDAADRASSTMPYSQQSQLASPSSVASGQNLTGDTNWDGLADNRSNTASSVAGIGGPQVSSIDLLQVTVSEIAAQPMENWNFALVASDVRRLIDVAPTPVERGRARLLLERIEEFESLARKSGSTAGNVVTASGTSGGFGGSVLSAEHSAAPEELASVYDATGYLVPVHAAAAGQPAYALTKKDGTMIAYVSPLPGMKLDHYVNAAVGIKGLRGYLPQLNANHLQAQRIVRIDH